MLYFTELKPDVYSANSPILQSIKELYSHNRLDSTQLDLSDKSAMPGAAFYTPLYT